MGGKCGKALLDALHIADINEDMPENGYFCSVSGRHHKSAHSHGCKKSRSFQQNGLTACVGACYYKRAVILAHGDIHGNDLIGVNKGVTCLFKLQHAVIGYLGDTALHLCAKV